MTNTSKLPVKLRPYRESDKGFVFSTYLKTQRTSYQDTVDIVYFTGMQNRMMGMISNCNITIACNKDDEDQIYGYVISSQHGKTPIIHFVYIKQPFRKVGLATLLTGSITAKPFYYTVRPKFKFRSPRGVFYPFYFDK